ncbi:MAG: hypothetical protein QXW71_00970 [Thermoplasmata archaeon]
MVAIVSPYDNSLAYPYDIFYNYNRAVAPPNPIYYGVWNITNNATVPLYYQYVSTVTLASGSTASISGVTTNLGAINPSTNSGFKFIQIANITANPSAMEIEKISITINRYTDSGYSNLFDTFTYPTINLHMYSDALSSVTVQETDNFAGNSLNGWAMTEAVSGKTIFNTSNEYYFDATSGYSLYYDTVNSNPISSYNIYKSFTPSSSATDSILELYIFMNALNIGSSPPFYIPINVNANGSNYLYVYSYSTATASGKYFSICPVKLIPGVSNTVSIGGGYYNNLGLLPGLSWESTVILYLGWVRLLYITSGTF